MLFLGFFGFAQFPAPYCAEAYSNNTEPITNVTFAGINNNSPATVGGEQHQNFLVITGGAVQQGGSYLIETQGNSDGDFINYYRVFFDWNNDGDFIDAGESYNIGTITNSDGADGKKCSTSVAVPLTAALGNVRMRVSKKWSVYAAPCNLSGYGQAEDYVITVSASTLCTGTPSAGTTTGPASVCSGVSFNLTNSGASSGGTLRSAWQFSLNNTTWNNLNNTDGVVGVFPLSQTSATYYRLVDTCISSGMSAISNVIFVSISTTGCPATNNPCEATPIAVNDPGANCTVSTTATVDFALLTPSSAPIACSGASATNGTTRDFWHTVTVPAGGSFRIISNNNATTFWDMAIYSITNVCGTPTYTQVASECVAQTQPVILVTGRTPGEVLYVRMWRDEASALTTGTRDYTLCVNIPSTPPMCTSNISPVNGATGITPPVTLSWNAAPGATTYTLFVSTTNPPASMDSITTFPGTSISLIGGTPNTTYYWFVTPKNADGAATGCVASVTSYTTAAGPANDLCSNAINLTVTNGFCGAPILGNLSLSDSTTGLGNASCQNLAQRYDVWYKATVPLSGKLVVQTSAVNTSATDLVIQAYSGTCGALVPIDCNDDGNPDPTPSAFHSKLGLTGRLPGEVIYYRVMPYNIFNQDAFAICAFDTAVGSMPLIAAGTPNACTPAGSAINLDSVWKYTWVTFKDAIGNVIGQVYPNGSNLGSTTASFYLNSGAVRQDAATIFYLDRNITITPATQPIGQVTTRLFFKETELAAFAAVAGGATRVQLNVSKTSQECASSAAAGDGTLIAQAGNGAYATNHFVDIIHTSFSTFYLHKGNIALPVTYTALTGIRNASKVDLSWTTITETSNKYFNIERSADGRGFTSVGTVSSKAAGGTSTLPIKYQFTDITPLVTTNYYRLKQTDISGKISYSNTVLVKGLKPSVFTLNTIFPNPAKDKITAALQSPFAGNVTFVVTDMTGKIIKRQVANMAVGDNIISLDIATMPRGSYLLKAVCNNGCETAVKKFNKL